MAFKVFLKLWPTEQWKCLLSISYTHTHTHFEPCAPGLPDGSYTLVRALPFGLWAPLGLILPRALPLMGFRGRPAEKDPTPTFSWEFGQTLDPLGSEATGKE